MVMNGFGANHDSSNRSCYQPLSNSNLETLALVFGSLGVAAFFLCCVAIGSIVYWKAYKRISHRLVLWLMISTLFVSAVIALELLVVKFENGPDVEQLCKVIGVFLEYAIWTKLLFTFWINFHLFLLTVLQRMYGWLEFVYVLSSLAIPATFFWVPLLQDAYGLAGGWCWIRAMDDQCKELKAGVVEQFALWYGPVMLFTVVDISMMIIMASVLCKRACCEGNSEDQDPLLPRPRHLIALKETLPLIAYPVTFHILCVFGFANRIQMAITHSPLYGLWLSVAIALPCWGVFASSFVVVHMCILRKHIRENAYANSDTEFIVSIED